MTAADDAARISIAAALLFTTRPTDRALDGWCGERFAEFDLAFLEEIAATRT